MPTIDVSDHPKLKRNNPGRQLDDWSDWIMWICDHYACSQADLARRCDVSDSHISQIKHGKEPSEEIMLCMASYAVDGGPRPPSFKISRRLNSLLKIYDQDSES